MGQSAGGGYATSAGQAETGAARIAITWTRGLPPLAGRFSDAPSVSAANDTERILTPIMVYDEANDQLIIGRMVENLVTVWRLDPIRRHYLPAVGK